jgi:hypothetical protein
MQISFLELLHILLHRKNKYIMEQRELQHTNNTLKKNIEFESHNQGQLLLKAPQIPLAKRGGALLKSNVTPMFP